MQREAGMLDLRDAAKIPNICGVEQLSSLFNQCIKASKYEERSFQIELHVNTL